MIKSKLNDFDKTTTMFLLKKIEETVLMIYLKILCKKIRQIFHIEILKEQRINLLRMYKI